MRAADLRIEDLLEVPRDGGVIRFGGRRTLLFDAVALGLLRKHLVEALGLRATRGLFTRLGYAHGWRTAESLEETVAWDDPGEWALAGGRLHRLQGLVTFERVENERGVAEAVWHDSYEAEQHVLHLGTASEPVCWTLVGFASGYLSRVSGEPVYAVEETCCACGDATCRMVARTQPDWGDAIAPHLPFFERDCLDASLVSLRSAIADLEAQLRDRRRAIGPEAESIEAEGIVARSREMQRVLDLCRRAAHVDSTLLITGESGVGKERIARFVHDHSPRAAGPFIAINCGAIPESLLESELFGHVAGAFSGAASDRPGLFEAANGGTLLLDELGEVPPPLQVRLLRVLQEREVRRVGENAPRPVDVRVLGATHRDLDREVAAGRFREDLYYRLRVIEVRIPSLRERPDDVLPLARWKVEETARRFGREVHGLTGAAAKLLLAHPWPGNVRELHNTIERAVVFAEGGVIDAGDLDLSTPSSPAGSTPAVATPPSGTLEEVERAHILATLEATGGNRAEAARRLGIGSATLFRRLRRWGR